MITNFHLSKTYIYNGRACKVVRMYGKNDIVIEYLSMSHVKKVDSEFLSAATFMSKATE